MFRDGGANSSFSPVDTSPIGKYNFLGQFLVMKLQFYAFLQVYTVLETLERIYICSLNWEIARNFLRIFSESVLLYLLETLDIRTRPLKSTNYIQKKFEFALGEWNQD